MAGLEIHEAAATGDHEALEDYLKTKKFNVNLKDVEFHNKTALHWACSKGYSECVRILLDYGAKGTSRTDEGWTPAHCAAEAGRTAALRALHTANVPVNRKDKYGDKPRRIAVIYGHSETVKYLAQAEAEIVSRRKEGCTSDDSDSGDDDDDNDDDDGDDAKAGKPEP